MATHLVVFKILFLVLIAHRSSFKLLAGAQELGGERTAELWAAGGGRSSADKVGADETAPIVDNSAPPRQAGAEQQVATSEGISPAQTRAGEPRAQVNYAELCYLSNGGSSLTLTVNEATQVGAIIGTIDVNGDPSLEGGNVELSDLAAPQESASLSQEPAALASSTKQRRLPRVAPPPPPQQQQQQQQQHQQQQQQTSDFYSILSAANGVALAGQQTPAIRLEPGTKNLVLVRKLDKESVEGEQSLLIQVRCRPAEREHRNEASTIPVRVLITDANDNAPEFVARLPYVVNISETAPVGSVAAQDLLAVDRDSAGPHSTLHYRVLDDGSAHSHLLQFTNPLEPTLFVAGPLDYESGASFALTIVASDQGEPEPMTATAQVQVNIIDFDDQNPRFLDEKYTLLMDESQQSSVGQTLQVLPRNLRAEDGDRGIDAKIIYSFDRFAGSPAAEAPGGALAGQLAALEGQAPDEPAIDRYLHLNPLSGEIRLIRQWPAGWASGAPMTLVVRAAQVDNKDRYTLTTLTITTTAAAAATTATTRLMAPGRPPAGQQGIEFAPDRLTVNVLESVAVNEKIARVKAKFLGAKTNRELEPVTSTSDDSVDLVTPTGLRRPQPAAQNAPRAAISYQILDDQMDQFGINGVGEIYVKKALDYELRREYKFRVLASYTKYSDICQVQVNVLNVNDNKPKFSQAHYTFHLTESRLRSNLIGSVQAHDADLNDTIHYALLGDHAHLFELNAAGQLSLRAGIKQLNVSSCQLIAQASDSLGPQQHSQQARINLHVAPQLIGRSLNLEPAPPPPSPAHAPFDPREAGHEAKLFNSRSLVASDQTAGDWTAPSLLRQSPSPSQSQTPSQRNFKPKVELQQHQQPLASNQRSSVATIVSSLQHMARSVNLLELPMSSALLLSALLAFLVCLLFIVIISMSVHFYRRHGKLRRRRHLAAAAHLRHAQLAARLQVSAPLSPSPPMGRGRAANTNGDSSSQKSSPTNSTAAGDSSQAADDGSPVAALRQVTNLAPAGKAIKLNPAKLTAKVAPSNQRRLARTATTTTTTTGSRSGSRLSMASGSSSRHSLRSPLGSSLSAQLGNSLHNSNRPSRHESGQLAAASATPRRSPLGGGRAAAPSSMLSSLSSHQSKRSYESNSTDDSSVMHCGHYSVQAAAAQTTRKSPECADFGRPTPRQDDDGADDTCSPVEAAIRSLVKASSVSSISQEMSKLLQYSQSKSGALIESPAQAKLRRPATSGDSSGHRFSQQQREMSALTNSKPGIKAYRKLPMAAGSLVRPVRPLNRVGAVDKQQDEEEEPGNGYGVHDSAIASDASSSSRSNGQQQQPQQNFGLMAMIREPAAEQRRASLAPGNIRWPHEIVPQRVKKLTWDDELSCSGSVQGQQQQPNEPQSSIGAALSPTRSDSSCSNVGAANHLQQLHYLSDRAPLSPPDAGQYQRNMYTGVEPRQHSAIEQHFLFSSSPGSPALLSASELSGAAGRPAELQQARASSRQANEPMSSMMLGQNNCLDYTIVQSSQFHVDSLAFEACQRQTNCEPSQPTPSKRPLPPLSSLYARDTAAGSQQPIYEPHASANGALRIHDLDSLNMTTAVL